MKIRFIKIKYVVNNSPLKKPHNNNNNNEFNVNRRIRHWMEIVS